MPEPILIVGAGQAGAQAVHSLRTAGYDGDLIMLGDEGQAPYQRPPLSKKFLAGEVGSDHLLLRPSAFYEQSKVDLRTLSGVTAIDVAGHTVETAKGERIGYSKLLIATGTRARSLAAPGADLPGVLTLRTIADVTLMRGVFRPGTRLVIIGAGYIGLEVAAVARGLGLDVTVLEVAPRVLQRVVSWQVSDFYQRLHADHGVKIKLGTKLSGFEGGEHVERVRLSDGTALPADLVLVAIGAVPADELAAKAGIECRDGILVDASTKTSAPDIYAAGDCTRFASGIFGRSIRLESVQNAIDQAKAAANAMLGTPVVYDPVPWFWSDQFDVKLQIAGLSEGHARTELVGDPAARSFAVSYIATDGTLLAVDAINKAREHMLARKAVGKPYQPGA